MSVVWRSSASWGVGLVVVHELWRGEVVMSLLSPNKDDDEFALAHADAGLRMRVEKIKKLRTELERLAQKYPQERADIQRVLAETEEWL